MDGSGASGGEGCLGDSGSVRIEQRTDKLSLWGNKLKLTPKLRRAPQPPPSHAGAPADADRAKRPPLVQHSPDSELTPGDRVEGLANFGKPTGEFGTVEQTNEDDALVKWDGDGRVRVRQPWLKKVGKKVHPRGKPASV